MERDPVCGMEIKEHESAGKSFFSGKTYYFCAPSCKRAFDNEPEQFLHKLLFELKNHHQQNRGDELRTKKK